MINGGARYRITYLITYYAQICTTCGQLHSRTYHRTSTKHPVLCVKGSKGQVKGVGSLYDPTNSLIVTKCHVYLNPIENRTPATTGPPFRYSNHHGHHRQGRASLNYPLNRPALGKTPSHPMHTTAPPPEPIRHSYNPTFHARRCGCRT